MCGARGQNGTRGKTPWLTTSESGSFTFGIPQRMVWAERVRGKVGVGFVGVGWGGGRRIR